MTLTARRVAIFGATSDIAIAFARRCAEARQRLVLVGRDRAALDRLAADLSVRGAPQVEVQEADFARTAALAAVAENAWSALGGLDVALIAYGSLPDQARVSADAREGEAALALNFVSPALLCDALAARFEVGKAGTIAVITSVAGDRGRQSNYLYGAAKGGLQKFLEGLRHRLFKANVAVLDVRPGFVATKMTAHLPQGGPLWATPEKVAGDIEAAIAKRGAVLYTPWFWFGIMAIVRTLPRPLFHRSKL
ncbi:SDR family oxidoreductase [Xanthobacter sp. VTT E-85241]|uniref:SDR family oxidoreductase n=1 Tax=Roseixanthobacter finlandensis TaxID=3119922 RepID=UPI00372987E7